jgi:hypothetical protein
VHRGAPKLFTTRWAMSYLAGPLTTAQIRTVETGGRGAGAAGGAAGGGAGGGLAQGAGGAGTGGAGAVGPAASLASSRPMLPPDIRELFVPPFARGDGMVYRPAVLASAEVRYSSPRHGVEETRSVQVISPLEEGVLPFSLDRSLSVDLPVDLLEAAPLDGAAFAPLPAEGAQPRSYDRWGKEMVRWIQGAHPVTLLESKSRKAISRPGETERDFRMRLADLGRESRDEQVERLRKKYESRFRTLEDRLRRAQQAVEKRASQSKQALLNTGITALGAVLGAAAGGSRSRKSGGLLGAFLGAGSSKATTAMRSAGRAAQTRQDVAHAEETVEAVTAQLQALEEELQQEIRQLEESVDVQEALEEVVIRPPLNGIQLRLNALAWLPFGKDGEGREVPLWR